MRTYSKEFVNKVHNLVEKENVRYVVFDDENLDILGTAKTIAQVKKIARKYLEEDCEEAVIMYYDDNEQNVFFLECC